MKPVPGAEPSPPRAALPDLRIMAVAASAWASAWTVWAGLGLLGVLFATTLIAVTWWLRSRRWPWVGCAAAALASCAALGSVALHQSAVDQGPVQHLASSGASVTALLRLTTDPVQQRTRFASRVRVEGEIVEVSARGRRYRVQTPVLLVYPGDAPRFERGATLAVAGTLSASGRPERAAVLVARTAPALVSAPSGLAALGNAARSGVRAAVAHQSPGPRGLVPALVAGQDSELPPQVVEDFQTSGMTHLLAVSGTNLTLIVSFLLTLARLLGVRAKALIAVGLLGVAAFLVLAGGEPSVLRAAAMGTIALIGLTSGGRERGTRALGTGVLALVLLDPPLARSVGFALSVSATAAILLLAPGWRDGLSQWLPRWVAEAVVVPLAAQLACTPLVAVISEEVSLVAVVANVAAAPLVAPATVLGLLGGMLALIVEPLGQLVAAPACWAAAGLIAIAQASAGLPLPALGWSGDALAILGLVLVCTGLAAGMRHLLVRRGATLLVTGLLVLVMVVPLPTPGWPPKGWVLVMCSVGQGDALVLRVAPRSAVVLDAGPDAQAIDQCLRRLGIREVPALVLTHFHADHVDGLAGVLKGRKVAQILTSPLADPAAGAEQVASAAAGGQVPLRSVLAGESGQAGEVRWQVLGPDGSGYPDSDSPPNDASVVLLVEVRGVRILLAGDQERPSQAALRRLYPGLRADVLKVAHHGSSKQDAALVEGLGARLALISVGADNGYGHPAPATLDLLSRAGIAVRRTDRDGDVAVVVDESGRLSTVKGG